MLIRKITLFLILSLCVNVLLSQSNNIAVKTVEPDAYTQLWDKFEYFELYQFSTEPILDVLEDELESNEFNLKLGSLNWEFDIHPHDIRSAGYQTMTEVNGENQLIPSIPNITYRGGLKNDLGADVRFAIMDQMIIGRVKNEKSEYIIENLSGIIEGAASDIYIVYETGMSF